MNGFLINDYRATGNNGMTINTGKKTEPGAWRAITPGRNDRSKKYAFNGKSTTGNNLKYNGIIKRFRNSIDSLRIDVSGDR
jgi:hypothetical protein